ncbi:TetR/AcrR family transcriptional regulator [Paraburkholderia sediminicola]|uniref:TetR/AcrR family transcriptional regulator n=1 Tax=Paraburkholderia sediminicola TaxID=458836 RepID=UPI0038BC4A58
MSTATIPASDVLGSVGGNSLKFYAAFGSKQAAFCEAVDLYIRLVGSKSTRSLNGANTAHDGLRAMLETTISVATSNKAGGCLLMLGVMNNLPKNDDVWSHLKRTRRETLALIRARLQRGVAEGDLPSDTNVNVLAQHFLGLTQTISLQARDCASRASLRRLIEPAMAAQPTP